MEKDVLYVRMFGGFSLEWNGEPIAREKARESQFSYLMQMVLHYRWEGVSKEEVKAVVFEERDLENVNHALRSVIYNARKKLTAAGLPRGNPYIEQRDGRYYWNREIPVVEDAWEMERLAREAEEEKDSLRQLSLYIGACHIYTGDFLSAQNSAVWVAQEARRYHSLFCSCVEKSARLLRERGDYEGLIELGNYAAKTDPLADWEPLTMEGLVSSGRCLEARKFYNDTLEMYLKEQGFTPSEKMRDMVRKLGEQMEHGYGVLDVIQQELSRENEFCPGGYLCPYPVFLGIYHMIRRMSGRCGQSVYLMLCTVVDSKGNPMEEGPKLEELSRRLEDCIRRAVRRSDVINRYGRNQYLVLLVNTTREDCEVVQKRITRNFLVNRQRIRVQYHVSSVDRKQGEVSGPAGAD